MPAFKRKAYIEFVSKTTVIITTSLYQKQFELKNKFFGINLFNLTKLDDTFAEIIFLDPPCPFMVCFHYDSDEGTYIGEVVAQIRESDMDCIGISDWKSENKKLFSVSVWEDD